MFRTPLNQLGAPPVFLNGSTMEGDMEFDGDVEFNGMACFSDGTAAAPSITFASDKDTGVYLQNPDSIGFATAGAQRMVIGPTGTMTLSGFLSAQANAIIGGNLAVTGTTSLTGDADAQNMDISGLLDVAGSAQLTGQVNGVGSSAALRNAYNQSIGNGLVDNAQTSGWISAQRQGTNDFAVVAGTCFTETNNRVNIGGGITTLNAATSIKAWTGATHTTPSGTQRMEINELGEAGFPASEAGETLHVGGNMGVTGALDAGGNMSVGGTLTSTGNATFAAGANFTGGAVRANSNSVSVICQPITGGGSSGGSVINSGRIEFRDAPAGDFVGTLRAAMQVDTSSGTFMMRGGTAGTSAFMGVDAATVGVNWQNRAHTNMASLGVSGALTSGSHDVTGTLTAAIANATQLNTESFSVASTGSADMNTARVINMGDPVNAQDAATKAYVDAIDTVGLGDDNTWTGLNTFTQRTTFAGGSAAAPGITLSGIGTGTGLWRESSDESLRITTAGVDRVSIGSTGIINTVPLSMGNQRILSVANPVFGPDAANMTYVDAQVGGVGPSLLAADNTWTGANSYTQRILTTDGTTGAPSYSFAANPGTGMAFGATGVRLIDDGFVPAIFRKSGNILGFDTSLAGNRITALGAPTDDFDAVNRVYVTDRTNATFGTLAPAVVNFNGTVVRNIATVPAVVGSTAGQTYRLDVWFTGRTVGSHSSIYAMFLDDPLSLEPIYSKPFTYVGSGSGNQILRDAQHMFDSNGSGRHPVILTAQGIPGAQDQYISAWLTGGSATSSAYEPDTYAADVTTVNPIRYRWRRQT